MRFVALIVLLFSASLHAADLPPRTIVQPPAPRPVPRWLKTNLRIGHLPGYQPRMVDEFLKAGFNVVIVNCLGNWDRVGPSAALYAPAQVEAADRYLRTVVEKIHSAGAKAMFYIGPVQVAINNDAFNRAHPDWLRTLADGSHDNPPNFANICTGYSDWLLAQLAYVTRTYGVDGFWFDGYAPVHLHSYDEPTRQLFRDFSGGDDIPLPERRNPVENPVARRYMAWHEQHFVDLADRMRAAIRHENPEAVIFANHSGNRTWYYPSHYMGEYPLAYSGAIDVSSIELYWDVPGDALYQQFCYAFMQAVTHERGATVWIQPSAHGISGVASPIDSQLRSLEGPPWGVYPEFVESAMREEYHKTHAANVKAREEWWIDSEALPYVGVVASEQTRTLYAQGALPSYFSHVLGAFRALFETHLPVRVLTELDLENDDLRGVRVLMLPNTACLSDRSVEVVRRFVAGGGGLVASHETSLVDADYARRGDLALGDVLHARYVATHPVNLRTENVYLRIEGEHEITAGPATRERQQTAWLGGDGPPPETGELALIASCTEVAPLDEAQVDGAQILATYRRNVPGDVVRLPAIIASTHGAGRAVYFAAGIDKAMFFYPDAYQRELLARAVRWAAGDAAPPAEVEGPLVLAATFRRQPEKKRIVVHLLNDHSSYGRHSIYQKLAPLPKELEARLGFPDQSELRGTWPVREEVIPLHGIVVRCRQPDMTRATLQPEGLELPVEHTDDGITVTVPKLEMHSMVVFE